MKLLITSAVIVLCCIASFGQIVRDSIAPVMLEPVDITTIRNKSDYKTLPSVQGTYIYSGKKTEIIQLSNKDAALSEKYGRQVYSKVPGAFIYDMDGTGNQVNISTRGLDPHRGWEYNVRKDGIMTNTDIYGYPASHYNIPMEAVDRIEMVRGTGSLQYGAQFGGMLNYVSKLPPKDKKVSVESINTAGSYGLVSTYNSISGTVGKFAYNVWLAKKSIDGYRENGDSKYDAHNASFYYNPNKKVSLKLEWTHSVYLIHLAGQQTDAMFKADPQASTRARNYYSPDIHIPSFTADWNISESTKLRFTASAVLGSRNSVMFDKPANIADTIVTATGQYNNRQVDIDNYQSLNSELRLLKSYKLFGNTSHLAVGVQVFNNDLHRRQMGKGSTGSDYDLNLVSGGFGRDMHLISQNIAAFAENKFAITNRWSVNAGMRYEMGSSEFTGKLTYYADSLVPNTIKHEFPLFGGSTEFLLGEKMSLYAGASQAYRPTIFKDIVPGSVYETSDPNLKDAFGYNAEIGFRGSWKFLRWDITAFQLQYNNRLGILANEKDSLGNLLLYRTNIGNSKTNGVELFLQGEWNLGTQTQITVFTATSYMDARYVDAHIRSGEKNVDVSGNKVESVPEWISRNGVTVRYRTFSITGLYSYTAESFADPLNTVLPNASGSVGLVPAYQVLDFNCGIEINEYVGLRLNANNILDEHYFTKRPQFYPGPGIWASDGRTWSLSVAFKL